MPASQLSRKIEWLVWSGLFLVIGTIFVLFVVSRLRSGAGSAKTLPVYNQVSDFALTNQQGQAVTLANLKGHPWVADIIFTRCAGPCPKMTREMKALQDGLP